MKKERLIEILKEVKEKFPQAQREYRAKYNYVLSLGLCDMQYRLELTETEQEDYQAWLYENLPTERRGIFRFEPGCIEPRILWLEEQINKLQNN